MSTTPSVTLHLGQMKTATTSLQAALSAAADVLAGEGVRYAPARGRSHLRETVDLLSRVDVDFLDRSVLFRHTSLPRLADGPPYWQDFVDACHAHAGRTLFSCEVLGAAGPTAVDRVASDLGDLPVRVVVTTRPLSAFLPSYYAETAKWVAGPPPDEAIRDVLRGLLEDGEAGPHAWLVGGWVRRRLEPIASDGLVTVGFDRADPEAYQREFWRALGIVRLPPASMPLRNPAPPAAALVAWQELLRTPRLQDPWTAGRVRRRLLAIAAQPGTPGSVLRLRPGIGPLVDACFPVGPPAGAVPLDELRTRLLDSDPVVEIVCEDGANDPAAEVERWRAMLDRQAGAAARRRPVARLQHRLRRFRGERAR
jgi:hypothetical protein